MTMLIYTLATRDYLPLMDLWLRQARPFICDKQLIVRALDRETATYCAQHEITVLFDDIKVKSINRDSIWILRAHDIHALVKKHGQLIHTDLDAFWLGDITQKLVEIDADLIISRELGIPARAVKTWGFSLCCGFFYIRYSNATEAFLTEWLQWIRIFGDDQLAINHIALQQALEWRHLDQGKWSQATYTTRNGQIQIAALDLALVDRVFPATQTRALIAHPWFERDLFQRYIKLLEFLWKRFQQLNPAATYFPEPKENLSDCDQCTRNTLTALELALRELPSDPDLLYLKGALLQRCGLISTGIDYMLNSYRAAPENMGIMSLYRIENIIKDQSIKIELTEKIIQQLRQTKTPLSPGDALLLTCFLIKNKTIPTFITRKIQPIISYLYFRLLRKLFCLG